MGWLGLFHDGISDHFLLKWYSCHHRVPMRGSSSDAVAAANLLFVPSGTAETLRKSLKFPAFVHSLEKAGSAIVGTLLRSLPPFKL